MLSERARKATLGLLADIAEIAARMGATPTLLTWLGFILSVFTAWLLSRGAFAIGGVLVVVAAAFDALDGSLARVTGRVSSFGAFLDSTLDRFSEAALYLGLLIFFSSRPGAQQELVLIYLTIVGSLMVSYTRARAEGLGYECKVGLFTRFERVAVLSLGLVLGQIRPALWILAAGSLLTALYRMWHVWKTSSNRGDERHGS